MVWADESNWYVDVPSMSDNWEIAQSKTPSGHFNIDDVPIGKSVCFYLTFDHANQADFDTLIPVTTNGNVATAIQAYAPAGSGTWKVELGYYVPNLGLTSFVRVAVIQEGDIPDNSSS